MRIFVISIVVLFSSLTSLSEERPIIQASDVVFMYSAQDPAQYDAYQGTVVGWGGLTNSRDDDSVNRFQQRVNETTKRGMRYCGSINFLVDFAGYIDFAPDNFIEAVCRDLNGEPLRVPWLWDHTHKGHPSYWFCFNHPNFQAFLLDQTERACLAPIEGLHIDDYSGTSHCSEFNGGCFCTYCMTGFREYMREKFTVDELKSMEILTIDDFHYGDFLESKGISADDFKNKHWQCPLVHDFQDYQNEQMKIRIAAVYEYAETLRGKPLVRSINSSASSPRTIIPHEIIDYFCGEIHQHASEPSISVDPVFVYRMVESLKNRQTATASGQDWAWIKANDKPGKVKNWIAQTYAFGSVFMVPHRQWCYTQELGTHWWNGKPEDFAYLYRFVREHADLLDEYVSLSNTLSLITESDFYRMRGAVAKMTEASIPNDLIYQSNADKGLLNAEDIANYDYIIFDKSSRANAVVPENSILAAVEWNDIASLPNEIRNAVRIEGSDNTRISLRYKQGAPDAAVACHLLNQDYRSDADANQSATVQVTIDKSLLKKVIGNSRINKAIIHQPNQTSKEVDVRQVDDAIVFSVSDVDLWAVVELRP
ncbi:MAG: hypothetical protein P9L94_14845 [Candidatus Hinthialibacter antarcticus]|nr:hypothetical protein [Candidatus Hinthialibacter antarcticus]